MTLKNKFKKNKPYFGEYTIVKVYKLDAFLRLNNLVYPRHILMRRLSLLSKEEKEKIDILVEIIIDQIDNINDIISTRVQLEKDEWK